ncbi:hypothetical protein [Microbacterium sp.]|uniref:hypothetical protein n=1 Tax=Microbacterium sp. TaxID=51671 RepID=UPI002810BFC6|nr:hypothetical protein [Microbacterium sp.]
MTAPSTLPLPVIATHEHAWIVDSAHRTSEGEIVYVHCTGCPARRVDVRSSPWSPPREISRPTRG